MYILIGASLIVAVGFLLAFLWAVRSGQFEDTYTPSVRMLFEDETANSKKEENKHRSNGDKLNER